MFIRNVFPGPERNFLVARDNLSTHDSLLGAFTGFKRFPGFRDRALNPYHDPLESPAPAFISHCQEFPVGHYPNFFRIDHNIRAGQEKSHFLCVRFAWKLFNPRQGPRGVSFLTLPYAFRQCAFPFPRAGCLKGSFSWPHGFF